MGLPAHHAPTWAPADEAIAVTKSDVTSLTTASRGLYVGTAGNVSVVMAKSGATVVFPSVPGGTVLPIAVTRVNSTGTTAGDFVALY